MIGLDSDFIIDFLNGIPPAVEKAHHLEGQRILVTPINIFEIFLGIYLSKKDRDARMKSAKEFFSRTEIVDIDENAGFLASQIEGEFISRGLEADVTDVLIAATYLSNGCFKIVSRDKVFDRIPRMESEKY